ncbi:MAG: hypothetical protein HP497_11895 [Nitrospira sp.]|nr:hypothetical protein [Nitrospira sp.]
MKTFDHDFSTVHDDAVLIRLGDFIAALDDQHPDKDQFLEVRENVPESGVFAVRLVPRVPE